MSGDEKIGLTFVGSSRGNGRGAVSPAHRRRSIVLLLTRAAARKKQQGLTAPSYESTLNAIRWRASWVSPLSRDHHKR
jgi:hypothetical protein